ncbi:MAG: autotransporter-associated beta strand repeat-containing protein [Phreatobacter sp.]|nr:autotransporter-associated beta strand repeat-containing protein [Phreatobacter sp.]
MPSWSAGTVRLADSANGSLAIADGGTVNANWFYIGGAAGHAGDVSVTGAPSRLSIVNMLHTGSAGSGSLTVQNGAVVTIGTFHYIARFVGSTGTVSVSGAGSSLASASMLHVGSRGVGTLVVDTGALFGSGGVAFIGGETGGTGTVVVRDTGSRWNASNSISVGTFSNGTLNVENGGIVSNEAGFIGRHLGSTGVASIAGSGSSWTSSTELRVGGAGTGSLSVASGGLVTSASGTVGNDASGNGTVTIAGAGTAWNNAGSLVVGASGAGSVSVTDSGTLSSASGLIGSLPGSNGTLNVTGNGSTWTVTGSLGIGGSGTGAVTLAAGGQVSVGGGAGLVTLAASAGSLGQLNIGAVSGAPAGGWGTLLASGIAFGGGAGTLVFNHTGAASTLALPITGNGTILHEAGTTVLTGDNSAFTGTTTISGGTLLVGAAGSGQLGGAVNVAVGGTLGGSGSITGSVTVAGTLAAGNSPGTLTIDGSLTLTGSSLSRFELNSPGVVGGSHPITGNDLVVVNGSLTLGGTLEAHTAAAGAYRLFNYRDLPLSGSFATTSVVGTGGFSVANFQVETAIPGQVNLIVSGAGQSLQFWDGSDVAGDGTVGGGAGTWSAANTNWTGPDGAAGINGAWGGSVGVFSGSNGGVISIEGTQAFDTLQFSTTGYTLSGGSLLLAPTSGQAGTIVVDAGATASISSPLTGAASLAKLGAGTLVLTGNNGFGGAVVHAGTLIGHTNSLTGNVAINPGARLVFDQTGIGTFAGVISGGGSLEKTGTGTVILSGDSSGFAGATTIIAGILQVGDALGGRLGGAISVDGGTLTTSPGGSVGQVTVASTASFANAGLAGQVSNAGLFVNEAGGVTGALTNAGTGSNAGALASLIQTGGSFANTGQITGTLTLQGGRVDNGGQVSGAATLASGTLVNLASGVLQGVTVASTASFANAGLAGQVSNAGLFVNEAGGVTGALTNAGTGSNAGALASLIQTGGSFANTGQITGTLTLQGGRVDNGGQVSGAATLASGTLVNLASGVLQGVTVASTASFANAGLAGQVSNAGLLENTGRIETLFNDGTAILQGSVSGSVTNAGTMVATAPVELPIGGDLINVAGATVKLERGELAVAGQLINGGTLDMRNGFVGDVTRANRYVGSAGSIIGIDARFSATTAGADRLVATAGMGSGSIVLNVLDESNRGFFGQPIVIAQGAAGSQFSISGLPAGRGLVSYAFEPRGDDWVIASTVDTAAATSLKTVVPSAVSGLTGLSYQDSLALIGRPMDPHADQVGISLFVRPYSGAVSEKFVGQAQVPGTGTVTGLARPASTFNGMHAGLDLGAYNLRGTEWALNIGLVAAFAQTFTQDTGSKITASLNIPSLGLYAALSNRDFTFEVNARRDNIDGQVSSPAISTGHQSIRGTNSQIAMAAAHRWALGHDWFVTPALSMTYSKIDLGALNLGEGNGVLGFSPFESLVARAGFTVGTTWAPHRAFTLKPFLSAGIARDLLGSNTARYTVSGVEIPIRTEGNGTSYHVGGGVSVHADGTRLIGFLRADARFSARMNAYGASAGIRLQF